MDDLTMTKLCAEAMGITPAALARGVFAEGWRPYDPLHEDTQAMALVKRFDLRIDRQKGGQRRYAVHAGANWDSMVMADDLNRAIVECVAQMQATTAKA